VPLSGRSPD
jgi:hypothetical protein